MKFIHPIIFVSLFFTACTSEDDNTKEILQELETISEARAQFEENKVSILKENTPGWESYRFSNFVYSRNSGSSFPSLITINSGMVEPDGSPLAVADFIQGGMSFEQLMVSNDTALVYNDLISFLNTSWPSNLQAGSQTEGKIKLINTTSDPLHYTISYIYPNKIGNPPVNSHIGIVRYPYGEPIGVATSASLDEVKWDFPEWAEANKENIVFNFDSRPDFGQVVSTDSGEYYVYAGLARLPLEEEKTYRDTRAIFKSKVDKTVSDSDTEAIYVLDQNGEPINSEGDFNFEQLKVIGEDIIVYLVHEPQGVSIYHGSMAQGIRRLETISGALQSLSFGGNEAAFFEIREGNSDFKIVRVDKEGNIKSLKLPTRITQEQTIVFNDDLYQAYSTFDDGWRFFKAAEGAAQLVGETNFIDPSVGELSLVSNGEVVYAYAENSISPGYQGGGSQWYGIEVIKFTGL
jgi:hypothetical protein